MGIEDVVEDAVPAVKGVKFAVYGAIIGVVILIGVGAYFLYKQHIKDQQVIAVQKEEVHEVKQDLTVANVGAKANDEAQTVATTAKNDLAASEVVIRQTLQKKVTTIKATVKDPVAQTEQVSQARLESVWETYCNVQPDNDTCKTRAAPAQAASAASEAQSEGPSK